MTERQYGGTFEELAMPLFDALYRYARCLARERAEAEDLVQETYVKALRGFGSFTPGTNFRAWIFRILRNTFLTSRTGLRETPVDDDTPVAVESTTPEHLLMRKFTRESLQRAIEALPAGFREVLVLTDVEEMSYKEIAETLSIPVGTVASRLIRARARLRKTLEGL